jgi:hypothetical protein
MALGGTVLIEITGFVGCAEIIPLDLGTPTLTAVSPVVLGTTAVVAVLVTPEYCSAKGEQSIRSELVISKLIF